MPIPSGPGAAALVAFGLSDVLVGSRIGLLVLGVLALLALVLLFVVVVVGEVLDDIDLDLRLGRWMQLRLVHPRRRHRLPGTRRRPRW